jgi:glycosyltransferase involved in cell wall biosynthesis
MSIHISAMLLSRVYGCKWIMDMRDPWEDNCSAQWSRKISHWFERQCISRADTVVLSSPGAEEHIRSQFPGVKTRTIMNGYDWTLRSVPTTEKLRILYTGTLYYNRDPFPFLRAFARLCSSETVDRELLELIFIGDCETWMDMSLSRWVTAYKLEGQISIRPPVLKPELTRLIDDSWVLLIFAQGQPKQIPGKAFEAIGSRRTLFVLTEDDSDTASVVRSSESGIVVPGHDEDAIHLELETLYGLFLNDRGALRRNLAQEYSRQYRNQDYQLLITSVLGREREVDTSQ